MFQVRITQPLWRGSSIVWGLADYSEAQWESTRSRWGFVLRFPDCRLINRTCRGTLWRLVKSPGHADPGMTTRYVDVVLTAYPAGVTTRPRQAKVSGSAAQNIYRTLRVFLATL
jgi:hypothetical protein